MKIHRLPLPGRPALAFGVLLDGLVTGAPGHAGPGVEPGDSGLRSDIQILADGGRIMSPTMVWPAAWGDDMAGLDETGDDWTPEETAARSTRGHRPRR